MAEVLTPGGLQGAALFNEDQILEAVGKYKPLLLVQFAKLGMRLSLQRLVNFEMSSHSVMAEVDKVVANLREEHRSAHNIMQASTTTLKVGSDLLAMTCVQAVTGCSYQEVMNGIKYREQFSPDVLDGVSLEKLNKLKRALVNVRPTNAERNLQGRDKAISLVRRACVKAGIDCLV